MAVRPGAQAPIRYDWSHTLNNPLRKLGFFLALVFVFLRFSFLHEILQSSFHINLYLLLIVGAPTTFVAIVAGALQRTFSARSAQFLALFVIWMLISVPFSAWIGDSAALVLNYIRATMPLMFIIAGLTVTLEEFYLIMQMVALGCAVNVLYAATFARDLSRLDLGTGSISGSNDFAAHLLFTLPFVLWVALTSRVKLFRFAAFLMFIAGLFIGAKAGSRGAMLGVASMALFAIFRANGMARWATLLVIPVLGVGLLLFLPQNLKNRYTTLFSNQEPSSDQPDAPQADDAAGSTRAREYLLKTSIGMTLQHPLLGVGPNEFLISEGAMAKSRGEHGQWQVSHNSYTEVSSEDGIPAFFFFLAGLYCTFRTFYSIYRNRQGPEWRKVRIAAFCLMLSMVGFGVAIFFLSLAYSLYIPAIIGLAISLDRAIKYQTDTAQTAAEAPAYPRGFPLPPRYAAN